MGINDVVGSGSQLIVLASLVMIVAQEITLWVLKYRPGIPVEVRRRIDALYGDLRMPMGAAPVPGSPD